MKLKQLALITTPEPRLLVVQPFDASKCKISRGRSCESKIALPLNVDGKIIRLPIPELSKRAQRSCPLTRQNGGGSAGRRRANPTHGVDEVKKLKASGELRRRIARFRKRSAKPPIVFYQVGDDHLAQGSWRSQRIAHRDAITL